MRYAGYCIAALCAVAVFELFLRLTPFGQGVSPMCRDEQMGMWHKPDFSGVYRSACYDNRYRFDERGCVANSYTPDPGRPDIVLLGDSYVEALMVPGRLVVHNQLYRIFGGAYDFYNYGLGGTSPVQHLAILLHKVDLRRIAGILHFISLDGDLQDITAGRRSVWERPKVMLRFSTLDEFQELPLPRYGMFERLRELCARFELYSFGKKLLYAFRQEIARIQLHRKATVLQQQPAQGSATSAAHVAPADTSAAWLHVKGAIRQIGRLARSQRLQYVAVVTAFDPARKKKLFEFLRGERISYIDVVAELAKRSLAYEDMTYACDAHWNADMHAALSRIIYESGLLALPPARQ